MNASLTMSSELAPCPLRALFIEATGLRPVDDFDREAIPVFLDDASKRAAELGEEAWPARTKRRVRDMLRHGKFRAAGRSKPASEFLLKAAQERRMPTVCGPVDVNNAVSVQTGLPASVFDASRTGSALHLRRGQEGERYLFNTAGHDIDLRDLLVVCREVAGEWEPCGNPVKDAMTTKIQPGCTKVIAVVYAPTDESDERLTEVAKRYCTLLREHCGATETSWQIVG